MIYSLTVSVYGIIVKFCFWLFRRALFTVWLSHRRFLSINSQVCEAISWLAETKVILYKAVTWNWYQVFVRWSIVPYKLHITNQRMARKKNYQVGDMLSDVYPVLWRKRNFVPLTSINFFLLFEKMGIGCSWRQSEEKSGNFSPVAKLMRRV